MKRTKASFKALRESLGISQQLLADLAGVNIKTVKRWESPKQVAYGMAPDDVWEILFECQEKQDWVINTALDKAEEIMEEYGEPHSFALTYWSSEEEYEQAHPGEGRFWQVSNARTRILSRELRNMGFEVTLDFPGIKAILEAEGTE